MAYEPGAWLPEDIQQKAPMDRRFVLACLSGLTRHNLVTAIGTLDGGSRFKITDLGATLVQVIRQSGPISQSGPESGA